MDGPSGSGKGKNKKKKRECVNPLSGEEGDDEYDEEEDEKSDEEEDEDQGSHGKNDKPKEWTGDGQEYVEQSEEESSDAGEGDHTDLDIKDVEVEDEEDRGSSSYPTDSPISPNRLPHPSSSGNTSTSP